MKNLYIALLVLIPGLLALSGCGDEDETSEEAHSEESIDDEGCEHMEGGPANAVSGASAMVSDDHMRYDIALTDVGGMNAATVTFNADEAGDFVVFLNTKEVPLAITKADGTAVLPEATEDPFDHCAEVAISHTFDFEVSSYTLTFGPTTATEVQIVIEHAGDAHEHGE